MALAHARQAAHCTLTTSIPNTTPIPLAELRQRGVDVRTHDRLGPDTLSYLKGLTKSLRTITRTIDLAVLHGSYQYPCYAASTILRQAGIPYVVIPHGSLDPEVRKRHRIRNRLIDTLYHDNLLNSAELVQFTSRREMSRCERKHWKRAIVVPLGIDISQLSASDGENSFRQDHKIPATARVFLYLSRVTRKKGVDILLNAFRTIQAQFNDTYLVLCGPVDADLDSLITRALTGPHKIPRFIQTGAVHGERKSAAISGADYFVLPTYSENFCYAAFEALAYGMPLISTTGLDWHAEIASTGQAVICEPTEADLLATLQKVLRTNWAPKHLTTKTREYLKVNFSWDSLATKMLEEYTRSVTTTQQ